MVPNGSRFLRLLERFDHFDPEFEANFFDVDLSFGYGARHCVGVHLARLELWAALEELLARVMDVRIRDPYIEYDSGTSRGPATLNIEFTPGPRSAIWRVPTRRLVVRARDRERDYAG